MCKILHRLKKNAKRLTYKYLLCDFSLYKKKDYEKIVCTVLEFSSAPPLIFLNI